MCVHAEHGHAFNRFGRDTLMLLLIVGILIFVSAGKLWGLCSQCRVQFSFSLPATPELFPPDDFST